MKCIKTFRKYFYQFLLLLVTLALANNSSAQNFSGLQGKELAPEISGRQVLTSVIDRLRDNNLLGMITSVKVQKDEPLAVSITVSFTGIDQGNLIVSVTDGSKNLLKGFQSQKLAIQKDKKELSVRLEVDSRAYTKGESFTAPRILIAVTKNEQEILGLQAFYKLDKKFEIPASDEGLIIPVKLVPVQSAAALPAVLPPLNMQLILPLQKLKMIEKPVYFIPTRTASIAPASATNTTVNRQAVMMQNMTTFRPLGETATLSAGTAVNGANGSSQNTSLTPEGPVNNPVPLWGEFITADVDFESQIKITSVNLNVFPDKNPRSGVFYYLPIAYDIKYDKENGFAFHIDYGTSRNEAGENKVRVSGTLSSGISLFESQFISNMLEVFKQQNPQLKIETAVPMPLRETPEITLSEDLKNLGITNLHISNTMSVSDPVEFSWLTDGTTAAEIETLLRANSGLTGTMRIKPASGDVPTQEIPVRIRLADENTLGRFPMTPSDFRTKAWKNETLFPIKLKYIHYMIIDKNREGKNGPIIYSWDLGGEVIPSRAQAKFDVSAIPAWLDNYKSKAARIWLDYSVADTCKSCNEQLFREVIRSTTKPQLSDIVFRILPFFSDYNISHLDVQVKSIYGEQSAQAETLFPGIHISKDSADYIGASLQLPAGSAASFEYQVTIVTKDGAEKTSKWVPRNSLSVPFGSFQVAELFPELKNTRQ